MRMPVLAFLAAKSLAQSRVTSILVILAVTAGVGIQVPNTANIHGYTDELLRLGLGRDYGHLLVSPAGQEPFDGAPDLARKLRALPYVRGVTVRIVHGGIVASGTEYQGTRIVGVEAPDEEPVTGFCGNVETGRCLGSAAGDGLELVAGSSLAERLHLATGGRVKLVLPYAGPGDVGVTTLQVEVVGILAPGGGFGTDSDAFVPRPLLRELYGGRDVASRFSLFLTDPGRVDEVAGAARRLFPDARVEPWWEVSRFLANAVKGNDVLALISVTMAILAVAIPVLCLLYVHVHHERPQVALLAAVGFRRLDLFVLYLLKAALLGACGVVLGIGAGLGLCAWFDGHPIYAHAGFVITPRLDWSTVATPALLLLGTTVVAGVLPAVLAARSNPSATIRERL